ncbi:hypothetical protein [Herbaspirillum sp. NPDC101396]|uniref:hypothetical protein n=1 Tax=Herbaspirillum sp. NPDC101396 TaxID=3364005 RepID=UPI00383A4362
MSEVEMIEKLANALRDKLFPAIPLSVQLWDGKAIAGYLHRTPNVVMERVVTLNGFPKPIRLPAGDASRGRPLWKATEVIAWAESHQEKKIGRPRADD